MSNPSYTILVAEDDSRTRKALAHSLEAAGYKVIIAIDGQEALDQFQATEKIDLVVLDVMMPRLDGFQVCQILRETSDIPIIMATVLGNSADRIVGLEMGATDYIVKPFSNPRNSLHASVLFCDVRYLIALTTLWLPRRRASRF